MVGWGPAPPCLLQDPGVVAGPPPDCRRGGRGPPGRRNQPGARLFKATQPKISIHMLNVNLLNSALCFSLTLLKIALK